MKVLNPLLCCLLLAGFIPETSWLSGVENGLLYCLIGLEQEGEQIERDLTIFEIRCQTGFGCCVSGLDIFHQETEVLEFGILAGFAFKLFSTCF